MIVPSWRLPIGAALVALVELGCKKTPTTPTDDPLATATPPTLLSVGSPTKDEDPSPLRAADGRLFVAWFSDRGGRLGDIYVSHTTTSDTTWADPVRVTTNPWGNFYPNLLQTSDGVFHVVWFEWVAFEVGQIRHASSADGVTWSAEEPVTTAFLVDDWLPSVVEAPNGTLLVYFVSHKRDGNRTSDLYLAAKAPTDPAWGPTSKVTQLSSPTEHDQLPFAVRIGNTITMVWVRHDTTKSDFLQNHRSDLYLATSSDGRTWSNPAKVTTEPGEIVNLFPELYQRHDGSWSLLWLSTRAGSPKVYEIPLDRVSQFPSGVTEQRRMPDGYSHRVVATSKPDQYLAVWVQGPKGHEDIYYRYLTR